MKYKEYLKSDHWQKVRSKALENQSECTLCGCKDNLHIHHKYYTKNGVNVLYNEHRYDDLLLVLCKDCHSEWHKYDEKWYAKITKKRIKQISKLLKLKDKRIAAFKKYTDKEYKERIKYLKTVKVRFA